MQLLSPTDSQMYNHIFFAPPSRTALSPSPHTRKLGILFDSQLRFDCYINHISRASFFQLKNIAPCLLLTYLPCCRNPPSDYCKSILCGQSSELLNTSVLHLLTHTPFPDHSTPVRQSLHWLPITQHTQFIIPLFTLNNQPPQFSHRSAPPPILFFRNDLI